MKKNSTKRALITSVVALFLCFTMLLGTTYAWFTDSVSSANNIITAGNLDIDLEYAKIVDGQVTDWAPVAGEDELFDPNALWEPGRVEVVYLKVSNLGSLALKYQLGVNVYGETPATNMAGEEFKLSDHLVFTVVEMPDAMTTFATHEEAVAAAGTAKGLKDYEGRTTAMEVGGVDYVALIVYMPETVGNEANYRGTAPSITLGVNLYATQQAAEKDSFDENYDKDSWMPGMIVYNVKDLTAALENGGNMKLGADIALTEDWTPVGTAEEPFTGVLDGNGHTISGLTVSADNNAALIAYAGANATIKNLNLENVDIDSNKYAAGVVCNADAGVTLENIKISGTIDATSYAGGIVFDADQITIKNCENNATITAGRASGIASWISNATVENVVNNGDITSTQGSAGIAGRFSGTMTNAVNNGTIIGTGTEAVAGIAAVQLGVSTYSYCVNNGDVTSTADNANASAAGILGQTPSSKVTLNYCINTGKITAEESYAAGIAYSLYGNVTANYCYNTGDVSGADGAGGISPKAQYGNNDTANYCLVDATVTSANGKVYPVSNKNNNSFYYNVDTLTNTNGTAVTEKDAKAALDQGTGGIFFKVVNGRLVASLAYDWVGDLLVSSAAELQAALDAATGEYVIVMVADITGDVTVTEKNDVKVVIDGNGHKFIGLMTIDGNSNRNSTAATTIQNVNFYGRTKTTDGVDDAYVRVGTRYTDNVSVLNCNFDGNGMVAVKTYTGGDENLVIKGCTVTSSMHSLAQLAGVDGVLIEDCEYSSKNGINVNQSDNVVIRGCTADVQGYAVRFGAGSGSTGAAETYLIENCTLKSACDDGDAVIILRGTAEKSTLTIVNTTLDGAIEITNTATEATVIR